LTKEKLDQLRYFTEFKIIKDSIAKINPEFSLCTVLVAYHGDNRNHSSIPKKTFEECLWTIYGIPIVGEWVRLESDQNKATWGSHGGRLILDESGIKYEQTTKPFGFVTEEAYKNAAWVEITEKDGHTKHEYLKLERCILWNSRYEECDSILEDNFGQSMEISSVEGCYRDDGYYEISQFVFSALCILGTAEPCFESAMIGRQFELDRFKQEYQLMMQEYKRASASDSGETDIHERKEDDQLGNIIFSEVCAKIKTLMAEHIFRYRTGKQYDKYVILSISETDKAVTVIDRENSYTALKIPYVATQTKEGLVVNIDYENKMEMALGVTDKPETAFKVFDEVEMIAKDVSAYDVGIYSNIKMTELTAKIDEVTSLFETAQARVLELEKHLEVFEKEKNQFLEQKHKDIVDALIASRREEMGKFSEYLDYCIKIDYTKTVEQVEKDIKEIHYNFMVKYGRPSGKKNFTAIEVDVADNTGTEGNSIAERYGEDIAKYFK
jgi:hypothetical protein